MIPASAASLLRGADLPGSSSGRVHDIRPADAGWQYVGFSEHRLGPGAGFERAPDDHEVAVLVIDGAATVDAGGTRYASLGPHLEGTA